MSIYISPCTYMHVPLFIFVYMQTYIMLSLSVSLSSSSQGKMWKGMQAPLLPGLKPSPARTRFKVGLVCLFGFEKLEDLNST